MLSSQEFCNLFFVIILDSERNEKAITFTMMRFSFSEHFCGHKNSTKVSYRIIRSTGNIM